MYWILGVGQQYHQYLCIGHDREDFMRLQFLGSGTAFTSMKNNYNSNMVLFDDSNQHLLMIDCGSDARHSTAALGLGSHDFEAVFISHLHADHVGGLEWMALTRKFSANATKPKLIVHPNLLEPIWEHVLSGGLQTLEEEKCSLDTYFELYNLQDDHHFSWQGIDFEMVQTTHIFHDKKLIPSYGLFFKNARKKIFITTDTQFTPDLYMKYYQEADFIFHDCETTSFRSNVHSHFNDLVTLPDEIRAKMWLYHHADSHAFDALKHGFLGFVERGQLFEY